MLTLKQFEKIARIFFEVRKTTILDYKTPDDKYALLNAFYLAI